MIPTCPKCGGHETGPGPLLRESQGNNRTSLCCSKCGHLYTFRETDAEFAERIVAERGDNDATG